MNFKNQKSLVFILFALFFVNVSLSQSDTTFEKSQLDIVNFLTESKQHSTLVKVLRASGLAETLVQDGPFTLFAPTDAAFQKLPKETLESLLKPENKEQLKAILTFHVIPGNFNSGEIINAIENNGGKSSFKTVNGEAITVYVKDGVLALTDSKNNEALVETADKKQANGFVHIVDTVVLPK